jgi:hypothetical protein
MRQVFIINVFANTSDPFVNPLFQDSTFELIPIREKKYGAGKWMVKYSDLQCFNSEEPLNRHLPANFHGTYVHNDPDLINMTYGDVKVPRSGLLERIRKKDWVAFYALLTPTRDGTPHKKLRGFYIVAAFEVEEIVRDLPCLFGPATKRQKFILHTYGPNLGHRLLKNAHARRWLDSPSLNGGMRMILVGSARSRRFVTPIRMTRSFCERQFRDKDGVPWNWNRTTELGTIGSYLRSIRSAAYSERLIQSFLGHESNPIRSSSVR